MKITFDNGRPILDAADVAPLLKMDVPAFREAMRTGLISTRCERGEGEDEGRIRLTFTSPQWRVRLTCGPDGEVLTKTRVALAPDPQGGAPGPAEGAEPRQAPPAADGSEP